MIGSLDIAVVGAGIAGLASAIMLSRRGHRVTVYERFATPQPIGSGLMLQPTGLAALERLGLRPAMAQFGQPIDRLHGVAAGGRTIFNLAYGDLAPELHALAVHRGALHKVLWGGFERAGARLRLDCAITTVTPDADGRALLADESGQSFPAADLVIDASGARSTLRGFVDDRQPQPFAYGAVWATVPDLGLAPRTLAQRYVAARIMLGYLPVGRLGPGEPPLAALFWSLKPGDFEAWRADFAGWRRQAEALWPELRPVLRGLAGPDDFTLASYSHFTAGRLSRGPVVLTGDAAHTTSPQLGQGANQGLIDAVVLADALGAAPDLAAGLARYVRMRRRHVRFYQIASALMTPFFQSDSLLLAKLRDLSFDRLKIVPYLHREMIRTLAGLKTGLFVSGTPETIVNCLRGEQTSAPALAKQ